MEGSQKSRNYIREFTKTLTRGVSSSEAESALSQLNKRILSAMESCSSSDIEAVEYFKPRALKIFSLAKKAIGDSSSLYLTFNSLACLLIKLKKKADAIDFLRVLSTHLFSKKITLDSEFLVLGSMTSTLSTMLLAQEDYSSARYYATTFNKVVRKLIENNQLFGDMYRRSEFVFYSMLNFLVVECCRVLQSECSKNDYEKLVLKVNSICDKPYHSSSPISSELQKHIEHHRSLFLSAESNGKNPVDMTNNVVNDEPVKKLQSLAPSHALLRQSSLASPKSNFGSLNSSHRIRQVASVRTSVTSSLGEQRYSIGDQRSSLASQVPVKFNIRKKSEKKISEMTSQKFAEDEIQIDHLNHKELISLAADMKLLENDFELEQLIDAVTRKQNERIALQKQIQAQTTDISPPIMINSTNSNNLHDSNLQAIEFPDTLPDVSIFPQENDFEEAKGFQGDLLSSEDRNEIEWKEMGPEEYFVSKILYDVLNKKKQQINFVFLMSFDNTQYRINVNAMKTRTQGVFFDLKASTFEGSVQVNRVFSLEQLLEFFQSTDLCLYSTSFMPLSALSGFPRGLIFTLLLHLTPKKPASHNKEGSFSLSSADGSSNFTPVSRDAEFRSIIPPPNPIKSNSRQLSIHSDIMGFLPKRLKEESTQNQQSNINRYKTLESLTDSSNKVTWCFSKLPLYFCQQAEAIALDGIHISYIYFPSGPNSIKLRIWPLKQNTHYHFIDCFFILVNDTLSDWSSFQKISKSKHLEHFKWSTKQKSKEIIDKFFSEIQIFTGKILAEPDCQIYSFVDRSVMTNFYISFEPSQFSVEKLLSSQPFDSDISVISHEKFTEETNLIFTKLMKFDLPFILTIYLTKFLANKSFVFADKEHLTTEVEVTFNVGQGSFAEKLIFEHFDNWGRFAFYKLSLLNSKEELIIIVNKSANEPRRSKNFVSNLVSSTLGIGPSNSLRFRDSGLKGKYVFVNGEVVLKRFKAQKSDNFFNLNY